MIVFVCLYVRVCVLEFVWASVSTFVREYECHIVWVSVSVCEYECVSVSVYVSILEFVCMRA